MSLHFGAQKSLLRGIGLSRRLLPDLVPDLVPSCTRFSRCSQLPSDCWASRASRPGDCGRRIRSISLGWRGGRPCTTFRICC